MINIPYFTFEPTNHLGESQSSLNHGGWFKIKYPTNTTFEIIIGNYYVLNYEVMRYTESDLFVRDNNNWIHFNQFYDVMNGNNNNIRNCSLL